MQLYQLANHNYHFFSIVLYLVMINRTYLRLSLLQFLQFFVWGSWFVTAGTYMMKTLDFSGREVGLVYANNAIAATVTPFLLGVIADRYISVEKLLAFLHFAGGCFLVWVSMVKDFTLFYPIILIYVLCYLPTFSLANALCFHHINDSKKDFPRVRVWGTIAWIAAGLLVGYLHVEDQVIPFRIAAGCSFILAIYSLTLPPTPPQIQKEKGKVKTFLDPEVKSLFKEKSIMILIICLALICVPTSYYYSFVNPFLNEIGVSNAAGKMSIGQVTEIIVMLLLPWFFINLRLKTIIFIGLLTWGVRYGLFILGIYYDQEWYHMSGLLLHGVAYVFAVLSAQIYIDTKVPASIRSTAQGFFSFLTLGLGAFIGTYLAGEMVNYFTLENNTHDWTSIWMLPTVFGIGVSILFLFLFKSKDKA